MGKSKGSFTKSRTLKEELAAEKGSQMADDIVQHFDAFNALNHRRNNPKIEELLLKQRESEVSKITLKPDYPTDIVKFNPSGSSKCDLELFYKATGVKEDHADKYPYHDRWTRNATAVHEAVQRDLLYAERFIKNPKFTVVRTDEGLPAWESNILKWKQFSHNGEDFFLYGMMDGILQYHKDGEGNGVSDPLTVGFEFKTKSTTIAAVGDYKMRDASPDHKMQCVAYSLLFGMNDFLLVYESLAKDGWMKNADARADLRAFHIHVTEEMRTDLLDKFAAVAKAVKEDEKPAQQLDKCFFCGYKTICGVNQ